MIEAATFRLAIFLEFSSMALFVRAQGRKFSAAAAGLALSMFFFADAAVAQEVRPSLPEGWRQLDAAGFVAAARQLFAAPLLPDAAHHREVVAHGWLQFLNDAEFVATANRQLLAQAIELFAPRRTRLVTGTTDEERAASQTQIDAALATLNERVRARMLADADYEDARVLLETLSTNGWSGAEQAQFAVDWMQAHDWRALPPAGKAALVRGLEHAEIPLAQLSARWSGFLTAALTRSYVLELVRFHDHDPGVRVWVNDQLVLDAWAPPTGPGGSTRFRSQAISLTAGIPVAVRIELDAEHGYAPFSRDATGVGLIWESSTVLREVIPASAWAPPEGLGEPGASGLKAEYFSTSTMTPESLVATRLEESLDKIWHVSPTATHHGELQAVLDVLRADLSNETYLSTLDAAQIRQLHQSGAWGCLSRHVPLTARKELVQLLQRHPAIVSGLNAKELGAMVETVYFLPGEEHWALISAWLDAHPQPRLEIGRLRDKGPDSYWERNTLPFASLGRWFNGNCFRQIKNLWDARLRRPDGGCDVPVVYLSVYAAALSGQGKFAADHYGYSGSEENPLVDLRHHINQALADDTVTADRRASWLLARAYVKAIANEGVPYPVRRLPDLEEAVLVAESPAVRFWALHELVGVYASLGMVDDVERLIQEHGQEVKGEDERAVMATWLPAAQALADYYAGGELRQRTAQNASYRASLEKRLAKARNRGDEAEVAQLQSLLSQLEE